MNGAEFLMYGGVIEKSGYGVGAEGAFTMYGGTIRDCHRDRKRRRRSGKYRRRLPHEGRQQGTALHGTAAVSGGRRHAGHWRAVRFRSARQSQRAAALRRSDFTAFELGGTVISDCEAWQGGGIRSRSSSAQAVMTGKDHRMP